MNTLDLQLWATLLRNNYGIPYPIDTSEDDYEDE